MKNDCLIEKERNGRVQRFEMLMEFSLTKNSFQNKSKVFVDFSTKKKVDRFDFEINKLKKDFD